MTTLDPRPWAAPPWFVVLTALLGAFVQFSQCGCAVDDPCAPADTEAMTSAATAPTTTAAILVATLSLSLPLGGCAENESVDPTTTTTTGPEPHSLGFGEPCVAYNGGRYPQELEPCKAGLVCEEFNYCDVGYCVKLCADDTDCDPVEGAPGACAPIPFSDIAVCRYWCIDNPCPSTLATEMECNLFSFCIVLECADAP